MFYYRFFVVTLVCMFRIRNKSHAILACPSLLWDALLLLLLCCALPVIKNMAKFVYVVAENGCICHTFAVLCLAIIM